VVEPPLSARIVLADTTVTTGGTINGEVVVANNTGEDLTVMGCRGIFAVALANEAVAPFPQWPACAQEITIPIGESVHPVTVSAQHMACSTTSVNETLVRCENDGSLPPLPPGQYEARLYQSTEVVPAPTPVEVRLTR